VLLLSIGTLSESRAATLLGDVISGSYDFPCVGCTLLPISTGTWTYFPNPFVLMMAHSEPAFNRQARVLLSLDCRLQRQFADANGGSRSLDRHLF
jgi:hypothetical protein